MEGLSTHRVLQSFESIIISNSELSQTTKVCMGDLTILKNYYIFGKYNFVQ
jgi:hypothetical protein